MHKITKQIILYVEKWKKLNRRDKNLYAGIAVLGLLIVVIMAIPGSPKESRESADVVMNLADNIRKEYRAKPNYWGLDTQKAINDRIIPQEMVRHNQIMTRQGQGIKIGRGSNGEAVMPGSMGFDIAYDNVNKKSCLQLLAYELTEQQKLGLRSITIENNQTIEFSWGGENKLPISPKDTPNICEMINIIIWSFE